MASSSTSTSFSFRLSTSSRQNRFRPLLFFRTHESPSSAVNSRARRNYFACLAQPPSPRRSFGRASSAAFWAADGMRPPRQRGQRPPNIWAVEAVRPQPHCSSVTRPVTIPTSFPPSLTRRKGVVVRTRRSASRTKKNFGTGLPLSV